MLLNRALWESKTSLKSPIHPAVELSEAIVLRDPAIVNVNHHPITISH